MIQVDNIHYNVYVLSQRIYIITYACVISENIHYNICMCYLREAGGEKD